MAGGVGGVGAAVLLRGDEVDGPGMPSDRPARSSSGVLPGSGRKYRIARTGSGRGPVTAIACLHGRNNDESFAFDSIGVAAFATALGLDVAVASLDGGKAEYWHPRRGGRDARAALVDELVPLMDSWSGGGPRALLGWSMGGYGALLAAESHPSLWRSVSATSAAVWRRPGDASAGSFDSAEDFRTHDVLAGLGRLAGLRVRVDCGDGDPFAATNRELLRRIPGVAGGMRPGGHNVAFWRTVLPEQLRFISA